MISSFGAALVVWLSGQAPSALDALRASVAAEPPAAEAARLHRIEELEQDGVVARVEVGARTVTVIVREPWKTMSAEQQNAFALVVLAHAIKTAATQASQVRVVDFTSKRQVGSYRP